MRVLALALVALVGCARASDPPVEKRALSVFAATSLRDVFTAVGNDFQATHPGTTVSFNFAGSQELRTQIEHGAHPDVFASADQHHMTALASAARVLDAVVFARNEPVVALSSDVASRVHTLSDLPNLERIVIGAPEVPIGRYTLQVLDRASALWPGFRARFEAKVVSRELNVRQVLAKVSLGEAQAGVVYRTDVAAAPKGIAVLEIPRDLNVIAEYPMAILSESHQRELGLAWVEFVLSDSGQRRLAEAGFKASSGDEKVR